MSNFFFQQKFYFILFSFLKISFFFLSFYFILFFQKKKFEIYCSQLTVDCYCSQLIIDCYCYCWSQYTPFYYNTILSSSMPPGHNTIGVLQYNLLTALLSCNTLRCLLQYTSWSQYTCVLQYNPCQASCYCNINFSPLHHHIAIQFSSQLHQSCNTIPILQYTFTSHSSPSLAIQFIAYKTRSQYNFYHSNPSLAIQNQANYTPSLAIQLQYNFSSPLSCNTIARLQYKFFFFTIQFGQ